jgi:hypothetical protein
MLGHDQRSQDALSRWMATVVHGAKLTRGSGNIATALAR